MTKKELAIEIYLRDHFQNRQERGVLMHHDMNRGGRSCVVVKEEDMQEAIDFAEDILNSYDKLTGYKHKSDK